jgi:hypothetical protein
MTNGTSLNSLYVYGKDAAFKVGLRLISTSLSPPPHPTFIQGELEGVSAQALKAYGGSRNTVILILKLTY